MNFRLGLIIISFLFFNCKKTEKKQVHTQPKNKSEKTDSLKNNEITKSSIKEEHIKKTQYYGHYYVISKNGANYKSSPKGSVIGKFKLNTSLSVIDSTKIKDQIKIGNKLISGEWIGVEKDLDTVFIFNHFLDETPLTSNIKLYNTSSYYNDKKGDIRTAFLNISETYFSNTYYENSDKDTIFNHDNLNKDTIQLNTSQRKKLLNRINISESDKAYIYSISNDSIETLNIKDLPAIACPNIYTGPGSMEIDYEFGFDLGKKSYGELVFIGNENPFQTGELKPIVWKKTDSLPKTITNKIERLINRNGFSKGNSYSYSNKNRDYYIQDLTINNLIHRYLYIINTSTNSVVYNKVFTESESVYLNSLKSEHEGYEMQWTGKLFKNKNTVIFGFESHSFGCPSITILDETEPAIPILCDNRH